MPLLNDWIDSKIAEIANKLPSLVHTNPASFSCGFNTGYKQAMLDLEHFMNEIKEFPKEFEFIYHKNILEYLGW